MHKNILTVVGITILFLGTCIIPSVAIDNPIKPILSGNTLYVGGSGPGNYSKIQYAIDNASDGDTVFVYDDSSPYFENLIINKSIKLKGEDKNNTIINGNGEGVVVRISADHVNISYFSIMNGSVVIYHYGQNYSVIEENIISKGYYGIELVGGYNNEINRNNVSGNYGIYLSCNYNNTMSSNIVKNCGHGIYIDESSENHIINNVIEQNIENIILINTCFDNRIKNNLIGKSTEWYGIYILYECYNNTIYHNNFYDNSRSNAIDEGDNTWDDGKYGNYWSDYNERYPDAKKKPFKGIWDTPYEIEGGNNKDKCPLINQWPKSRTRTTPRTKTTAYPIIHWFLERFLLLEKLLNLLR